MSSAAAGSLVDRKGDAVDEVLLGQNEGLECVIQVVCDAAKKVLGVG